MCNLSRNFVASSNFEKQVARWVLHKTTFLATCLVSDNHIRLEEHFHWPVPQSVATQVAVQMLHKAMIKKNVAALRDALPEVELISTSRNGGGNKSVAWNVCCRVFYNHKWATFSCNLGRNKIARQVARKIAYCNIEEETVKRVTVTANQTQPRGTRAPLSY